jgi:hypothetical protein
MVGARRFHPTYLEFWQIYDTLNWSDRIRKILQTIVWFYAANRMRYTHFVWHLFVLAGTTCHFIAVLRYAA